MTDKMSGRAAKLDASVSQMLQSYGVALIHADRNIERRATDGLYVTGITIRVPQEIGQDYLVTLRAGTDEGSVVSFHGAMTFGEAVTGALNRLQNGTLKWREDQYAKDKGRT